jgi:hypothetical protein
VQRELSSASRRSTHGVAHQPSLTAGRLTLGTATQGHRGHPESAGHRKDSHAPVCRPARRHGHQPLSGGCRRPGFRSCFAFRRLLAPGLKGLLRLRPSRTGLSAMSLRSTTPGPQERTRFTAAVDAQQAAAACRGRLEIMVDGRLNSDSAAPATSSGCHPAGPRVGSASLA